MISQAPLRICKPIPQKKFNLYGMQQVAVSLDNAALDNAALSMRYHSSQIPHVAKVQKLNKRRPSWPAEYGKS